MYCSNVPLHEYRHVHIHNRAGGARLGFAVYSKIYEKLKCVL
jgi:hypothetical protein